MKAFFTHNKQRLIGVCSSAGEGTVAGSVSSSRAGYGVEVGVPREFMVCVFNQGRPSRRLFSSPESKLLLSSTWPGGRVEHWSMRRRRCSVLVAVVILRL
jgi:hypothetical protein